MLPDIVYAQACAKAYEDPASISRGDCDVLLAETNGVLLVSFRGSEFNLDDWATNFDADEFLDPQLGPIHDGYHKSVSGVFEELRATIGDRTYDVTGHSKGGGEGLIFSARMTTLGHAPRNVVTCGAPRVGKDPMRRILAPVAVTQYLNGGDPVPTVPDWFEHMRILVPIGQQTLFPDIFDHSIRRYIDAMA